MNIKTIIATVVALAASPLALASGHTMEFYVGGDMGQVSLNDHSDDCDALVGSYVAAEAIAITSTVAINGASTPATPVTLTFPKSGDTGASTRGSCEDAAFAPRMVVGYKVNDMFSVEGFFGWASGFDAAVNNTPGIGIANNAAVPATLVAFEDKTEVDYTYFGLVLNGQYEVSRGIMVGGKIGIQQASADATRTVSWTNAVPSTHSAAQRTNVENVRTAFQNARPGVAKENKTEAIYGIGAAYQITDELSVRAGYDLSGVSNYMHGGVTYSLSF